MGREMCHVWEEEKLIQDYWVNLNERDYLQDVSTDGRVILKGRFKK
jgi:hypothetical protein